MFEDEARAVLQVARARVITQTFPNLIYAVGGSLRQCPEIGKFFQESVIIGNDGRYARLLEHGLGDPRTVRRANLPPRQVAAMFIIVGEEDISNAVTRICHGFLKILFFASIAYLTIENR